MKKLIAILGVTMLMAAGAPAAQADIIDLWSFELDAVHTYWKSDNGDEWTYGSGSNPTGIRGTDTALLSYHHLNGIEGVMGNQGGARSLSWGGSPGTSSLTLNSVSGTMSPTGEATPGLTFTHENSPIYDTYPSLSQGSTLVTMALSAGETLIDPVIFAHTLDFFFIETPNGNRYTEQDVFVVENPFTGSAYSFVLNNALYTVSFGVTFEEMSGYYADLARATFGWDDDKPVYGWTTKEDQSTTIPTFFTFTVETLPVPEPATMMLLGLGLAGLGLMARRRRLQMK